MSLFLVPVPLFNKFSAVEAYMFRYRLFDEPSDQDPAGSELLQALNTGGVDAFAGGKPLFVPIHSSLLPNEPERACRQPPSKIVFYVEDEIPLESTYIGYIAYLRQMGFRFALPARRPFSQPSPAVRICDYLFLGAEAMKQPDRRALIVSYHKANPDMSIIATGLETPAEFERAIDQKADLFEGQFYYMPLTKGENKITPLKANLLHLLNVVRDENFEFFTIASIVQRDPALSVSLMRFINSPYLGVRHKIKTIQHAVTVLGQEEVRKWVTAAVFKSLGTDRPNELVRLSLVRAKFAENLAPCFKISRESGSLFLMGLFSALDVILETSMDFALDIVLVSDEIRDALVYKIGKYAPVLNLMVSYERASWKDTLYYSEVHSIAATDLYEAYINAISWYNDLITERVHIQKRG